MGTDNKTHGKKSRVLNREVFYKDDIIIKQGDQGCRAYYIENGQVEVSVQDGAHIVSVSKLGRGEIFGEMSIIQHTQHSASVKALEQTTLTVISKSDIEKMIDKIEQQALRALLRVLSDRLKKSNQKQLQHYKSLAEFHDHMTGLIDKISTSINTDEQDNFRKEAEPLLEQLTDLLDHYRSGK